MSKGRTTQVEKFRYAAPALVDAARLLPEYERRLVIRRLADRETWQELATAWDCGPCHAKTLFRKACEKICLWLDQKNGRGILPPPGTKRPRFGLFRKA